MVVVVVVVVVLVVLVVHEVHKPQTGKVVYLWVGGAKWREAGDAFSMHIFSSPYTRHHPIPFSCRPRLQH